MHPGEHGTYRDPERAQGYFWSSHPHSAVQDSIVVTSMGAETLPFLSAFGVLPASLAFFVVYNKLVAKLPPKLVFAAAVTPLAAFYVLFASVIYPAADVLHPYGATTWVSGLALWPKRCMLGSCTGQWREETVHGGWITPPELVKLCVQWPCQTCASRVGIMCSF